LAQYVIAESPIFGDDFIFNLRVFLDVVGAPHFYFHPEQLTTRPSSSTSLITRIHFDKACYDDENNVFGTNYKRRIILKNVKWKIEDTEEV
jgi:hypothetical protein